MITEPLYFDYCATTPCDQRVVEEMLPYFTRHYGNTASRDHGFGWLAKEAAEQAREQVAHLIQASPKQIVFTSGATEAINLALKGLAETSTSKNKGNHIITAKTEHTAVLDTCAYLEEKGFSVTYLSTDAYGMISLDELEQSIRQETICIALMYANNETGVIHPVKAIGAIARKHGVCFMCDATQAVGKIPVNAADIDLMPFSAHKLYGPKGVGALYVRDNKTILQQLHGGAHERGNRSGTLNTPGIVGFGKAAELCSREKENSILRDKMEQELLELLPGSFVNGGSHRLPHVSNILFPGIDSEQLLLSVSKHLALSRGSACSGIVQQPSHVLMAMGLTQENARNSIRISLGRFTKEEDVNFAVSLLTETVRKLQLVYERD